MFVPLEVGGSPDLPTRCYDVLRAAVGVGGSAEDDTGIDGCWRMARAIGMSIGIASIERAAFNFVPAHATDNLDGFATHVKAIRYPGESDGELRDEVVALYPAPSRNDSRSLVAMLEGIDPRLSIQLASESVEWVSDDGRSFGPTTDVGEGYYGPTGASGYALYTSRCLLRVLFDVGHTTALSNDESRVVALVRKRLRAVLPSWWDFRIVTSIGFLAGVSPVGLTGFED